MCSACFNLHAAIREGTEPSWAVSLAQGVRTILWAGEAFRWSWRYSVKGPLWGVGPISCKSPEWRPQPLKARVLRLILIFSGLYPGDEGLVDKCPSGGRPGSLLTPEGRGSSSKWRTSVTAAGCSVVIGNRLQCYVDGFPSLPLFLLFSFNV